MSGENVLNLYVLKGEEQASFNLSIQISLLFAEQGLKLQQRGSGAQWEGIYPL